MEFARMGLIKRRPFPGARGICPSCGGSVIAKCGAINVWHWAHEIKDCDAWSEPETPWHREWKRALEHQGCALEVVRGPHRADVVNKFDLVVELQHSSISTEEIAKREAFYGHMVWLIDATEFADNFNFRTRDGFDSFRWRHPRKSLWECEKPLFFDMYEEIFVVKKIHSEVPCGGWGYWISHEQFVHGVTRARSESFDPRIRYKSPKSSALVAS